jgi:hypothetical protein
MLSIIPVYWRLQKPDDRDVRLRTKHIIRRFQMTKINRGIIAALVLGILAAGLSGCKKEGPMERTGKEIDKVGDTIKDAVKDLKK